MVIIFICSGTLSSQQKTLAPFSKRGKKNIIQPPCQFSALLLASKQTGCHVGTKCVRLTYRQGG